MSDIKQTVLEINGTKTALGGLEKVLDSIAGTMREVFSVKGFADYKDTVTRLGKDLADALLTLQLSFGRMKYAIAEAVAPIATVFVPWLNAGIQAVIRFSSVVSQFLRGLIAGITGNRALAGAAKEATQQEEQLGAAAKAAGKAARRTLASFDQIERLGSRSGGSGGGGLGAQLWGGFQQDPISPQIQAVVDKILALLKPLMEINLEPLKQAMQTLGSALSEMGRVAGDALGFLWYQVLTPFAAWIMEVLAPVLMEGWAAMLQTVTAAMEPVVAGIRILWEALKPVVAYIGEIVIGVLRAFQGQFEGLTLVFREKSPEIRGIFQNIAQVVSQMWAAVSPVLRALEGLFSKVFAGISQTVAATVGYLLELLYSLTGYLAGAFSGSWSDAWGSMQSYLRTAINGVIGLLNSLVSRLASALNAVAKAANRMSFTVPDWVPVIGGRHFGVSVPYVSAPSIPYLAKGAVLPAGKPFLAMVGDQTHGTNVEAPLATIQEAVALVLEDQAQILLQGFHTSTQLQQEILRAVLGIRIGDETIGRAADRYRQSMAIMRGGY